MRWSRRVLRLEDVIDSGDDHVFVCDRVVVQAVGVDAAADAGGGNG